MIEQKVIRTYKNGYTKTTEILQHYLDKGYVVVFATPFNEKGNTEYVEYIIQNPESRKQKTE